MPSHKRLTTEEKILALYRDGNSIATVARRLSLDYMFVSRVIHAKGGVRKSPVRIAERPLTPEMEAFLPQALRLASATVRRFPLPNNGGMDEEDWEQLARIDVLNALKTYDPTRGASLQTWIIYYLRGQLKKRRQQVSLLSGSEWEEKRPDLVYARTPLSLEQLLEGEGGSWEPSVTLSAARQVNAFAVREAFATLPEEDRILLRAKARGERLEWIATRRRCSREWARNLLNRAAAAFREALEAQGITPEEVTA